MRVLFGIVFSLVGSIIHASCIIGASVCQRGCNFNLYQNMFNFFLIPTIASILFLLLGTYFLICDSKLLEQLISLSEETTEI